MSTITPEQIEVEIVDNSFRTIPKISIQPDVLMETLMMDYTVKVKSEVRISTKYYRWAKSINKSLRTRKFNGFTVLWLEDKK